MIPHFSTYKIKVKDKEFISPEGTTFSHTAILTFFDENHKEVHYHEMAYIDVQVVYDAITQKLPINVDYCFIENFSIEFYRKNLGIEAETLIEILDFSAKNAIFESNLINDFNHLIFTQSINFSNTLFLNGGVNFSFSKFEKGIKCHDTQFRNGNILFLNTVFEGGKIDFKNAVFGNGNIDFQYALMGEGEKIFTNTNFGDGDISFINANFGNGDVSFKMAIFGDGKIDFHYAIFGAGDKSFERTEFGKGRVDFRTVEFGKGRVNFNKAVFNDGDVYFDESEMESGKLLFKNTVLGEGDFSFQQCRYENAEVNFERAVFGKGSISFYQSTFKILSLRSCHINNFFDLRVEKAELLDLSNTVVRDVIDLYPSDASVKIDELRLNRMRLQGRLYVDWRLNNLKKCIYAQKQSSLDELSEQFRVLKQNFNQNGKYDDEDLAYIEFKRNEAKAVCHHGIVKKGLAALIHYPAYWFKLWVYDKMGLFATSPMRVLVSTVLIYFVFVFVQFLAPFILETSINCIAQDASVMTKFWDTAYYSAITYLTIGYGDCSPLGFLRLVASIEGFVGVFMMSYFTVAFARKILR